MGDLDQDQVKAFYEGVEEIWPADDLWHLYSKMQIEKGLGQQKFSGDAYILNAGSGGNDYGLSCEMHHVDIAKNKIQEYENHTVASIDQLPFPNEHFTDIICVGSVLNYCSAVEAIAELSRVLRQQGILILEYESSHGFGYIGYGAYKQAAALVSVKYRGEMQHRQWLYSPNYINGILKSTGMVIIKNAGFHYVSGLYLKLTGDEQKAAKYGRFDAVARWIPFIQSHAHNIFVVCRKQ